MTQTTTQYTFLGDNTDNTNKTVDNIPPMLGTGNNSDVDDMLPLTRRVNNNNNSDSNEESDEYSDIHKNHQGTTYTREQSLRDSKGNSFRVLIF